MLCSQDFQEQARQHVAWLERQAAKQVRELEQGWQLKVNCTENKGVQAVREEAAKRHADARRRADEAKQADALLAAARGKAEALRSRLEQEQAATQRLRESRFGAAIERQRQLEQENVLLKQRRKVNQRKISDANLADRRAAVALEQAAFHFHLFDSNKNLFSPL